VRGAGSAAQCHRLQITVSIDVASLQACTNHPLVNCRAVVIPCEWATPSAIHDVRKPLRAFQLKTSNAQPDGSLWGRKWYREACIRSLHRCQLINHDVVVPRTLSSRRARLNSDSLPVAMSQRSISLTVAGFSSARSKSRSVRSSASVDGLRKVTISLLESDEDESHVVVNECR